MNRRRWRTVVLWVGCTFCVLIAATFVVSGWWLISLEVPTAFGPAVTVRSGALSVLFAPLWNTIWHSEPIQGWPHRWVWWNRWTVINQNLFVPLYALFLAVAVPTLLVWRFVPKFPRGHCRRCGYNLTGLTEARCPECGQPFEAKGDAP